MSVAGSPVPIAFVAEFVPAAQINSPRECDATRGGLLSLLNAKAVAETARAVRGVPRPRPP